jgi:hypothetical protein
MRALAEYVMRGRLQAVLIAVITAALPLFFWLSAAVIGLVTLRHGWRQGLGVLMWALLPASLMAWYGEIIPAVTLAGTLILAQLLRESVSWSKAMFGAAIIGALLGVALLAIGAEYLAVLEEIIRAVLSEMEGQLAEQGRQAPLIAPVATEIAGVFGAMQAMTLVACLLLARWWQAMLYNPGGFRQEFHGLRLSRQQAIVLVFAAVVLYGTAGYAPWAWIAAVPFLFAGLGLVHSLVNRRGIAGHWLGVFYFLLVVIGPMKQAVAMLALVDSWLDLRKRVA